MSFYTLMPSEPDKSMSIQRAILIAFISLTIISASLMTGMAYYRSRDTLENEIRRNIDAQALSAMRQIDTLIFERLVNLYGWSRLAVMQDVKVGDVDKRLSRFLRNMQKAYAGLYVDLMVTEGSKVVAASRAVKIGQPWIARPAWLQLSIEGIPVYIERPEKSGGQSVMEMRAPVRDVYTEQPLGHLVAMFNWAKIVDVLNTAVQSTGRVGLLIDDKGNILAASDTYEKAKLPGVSDYSGVALYPGNGSGGYGLFGKELMLTGSASKSENDRSGANNWKVVIIDPLRKAFQPIKRLLATLLILLVITIIGAVIIAIRLARTISRPVRELTELTAKIPDTDDISLQGVKGFSETNALAQSFDRMLGALASSRRRLVQMSKLAAVGEMSAMLAHEIRNPLGILRSSAQLMGRRTDLTERDREMIGYIISESDRINDLVTNLLERARPREPVMERREIAPIVEHVIEMLENKRNKKGLRLSFEPPDRPWVCECDRDQMIQVFFNLIMNAMQAVTDGEGEISVRIYKKRHEICVDIDDNGPGVSSDKRDEILEPFVSNREGGMGLGLSIVVEILRSHGGYLQISQSEQQGARFTVCLPAAT